MISFDVPIVFSGELLVDINNIQYYGMVPNSFPSGRPNDTKLLSKNEFQNSIMAIRNIGGEINYLLNGSIGNIDLAIFHKHIQWIISEIKPDIITFSNPRVYHYLKSKFNFRSFEISAIAGINSEIKFNKFISSGDISISDIKKIVLHHDATITGSHLSNLIESLHRISISPRVLVTESCYYNCPFRKRHYDSLLGAFRNANQKFIDLYQFACIRKRLLHPETLFDLSGFLLPEELHAYSEKTGINAFKISGRSKSSSWISNTVKSYINFQSKENIYELIVFTAPGLDLFGMDTSDLFFLRSDSYLEISSELAKISDKKRKDFIKEQSVSLFLNGGLRINDPNSVYDVINGKLTLVKKGDYLQYIDNTIGQTCKTTPRKESWMYEPDGKYKRQCTL